MYVQDAPGPAACKVARQDTEKSGQDNELDPVFFEYLRELRSKAACPPGRLSTVTAGMLFSRALVSA